MRRFPIGIAALATLLAMALVGSPAAAFEVLKDTGVTGGYRFLIVRKTPATFPDFKIIFKSKILKARASKTSEVSFPWRKWTPPESLTLSDYRVVIDLKYYKKGSRAKVGGKVRGAMDVYRAKHPGEADFTSGKPGTPGVCAHNFWS